jgi:hypothetical protein
MIDFLISLEGFKGDEFANVDLEIPTKSLRGSPNFVVPVLRPKAEGDSQGCVVEASRYLYIFVRRTGFVGQDRKSFWEICQPHAVMRRRFSE